MQGLTVEEQKALLRSVGTHRADRYLSPLEVGRLLKKAISAGSTRRQCADDLQIGQTQVGTFLKLPDLNSQIRDLADWGGATRASIPFSSLAELARLPDRDQVEAANAILKHGLTWKEVVQLVQMADRSSGPLAAAVDQVLRLRPEIDTRYVFVGAITSEALQRHIEGLLQHQRDAMFERAITALFGDYGVASGRLGANSFTLISAQDLPQLLGLKADELEQQINDALDRSQVTS